MNSGTLTITILAFICVAGAVGALFYAAANARLVESRLAAGRVRAAARRVANTEPAPEPVPPEEEEQEQTAEEIVEPEAAPKICNVPYQPNGRLAVREGLLEEMHKTLESRSVVSLVESGPSDGGVGKTRLAAEYAHTYSDDYSIVWWIRASRSSLLAADFSALAEALGLKMDGAGQDDVRASVVHALSCINGWLLILDDAEDPDLIRPYLPRSGSGHVVITSQSGEWWKCSVPIAVQGFERMASIEFIFSGTKETNGAIVTQLAALLDDLPLALDHCVTYISRTGVSVSEYLSACRTRKEDLVSHVGQKMDRRDVIGVAVGLSAERVTRDVPASENLLNVFSFLSSEPIPVDLLKSGVDAGILVETAGGFGRVLSALHSSALIELCGDSLLLHSAVQMTLRNRLDKERRAGWAAVAVRLLENEFTFDPKEIDSCSRCSVLLPHALAAADHAQALGVEHETCASLLREVAVYLRTCGNLEESRRAAARALLCAEEAYGSSHPKVAVCADTLARTLHLKRDLPGAREFYERALQIDEAAYGEAHPSVAARLSNLGEVLCELGESDQARSCLERALKIAEDVYGGNHANVALRASELAHVLEAEGNYKGSRELLERALRIDETAYGMNHPGVAGRAYSLGVVLVKQGELDLARPNFDRALKIDRSTYGPEHPRVAVRLAGLGAIYEYTGDLDSALSCYEDALEIEQTVYGQLHPKLAGGMEALARVLQKTGDYASAARYYAQLLDIVETVHGPEDPRVAEQVVKLGCVCRAQGDLEAAQGYLERGVEIQQAVYGPTHLEVANALIVLAEVMGELGDSKAARTHLGRALLIRQEQLGLSHPDTETLRRNLAASAY